MGCFGGGGSTNATYPAPSATEETIRAKTLANMNKSEALTEALLPSILKESGLKSQAYSPWAHYDIYGKGEGRPGYWIDPAGPKTSGNFDSAAYLAANPDVAGEVSRQAGSPIYSQMTDAEMRAGMTPAELATYEISLLQADRTKKALEGTLPISPQLEKDLGQNQSNMEEYLSRVVGPNWKGSTAGKQMTDLLASNELIREEARRGEISSGTQNLLNEMGFLKNASTSDINNLNSTSKTFIPLVSGYESTLAPYQQDRAGTFQADTYNAQQEAQNIAGNKQLLGTIIGAGITGGMSLIPQAAATVGKSAFSSSATGGGWDPSRYSLRR
jgi:hypothetical protein